MTDVELVRKALRPDSPLVDAKASAQDRERIREGSKVSPQAETRPAISDKIAEMASAYYQTLDTKPLRLLSAEGKEVFRRTFRENYNLSPAEHIADKLELADLDVARMKSAGQTPSPENAARITKRNEQLELVYSAEALAAYEKLAGAIQTHFDSMRKTGPRSRKGIEEALQSWNDLAPAVREQSREIYNGMVRGTFYADGGLEKSNKQNVLSGAGRDLTSDFIMLGVKSAEVQKASDLAQRLNTMLSGHTDKAQAQEGIIKALASDPASARGAYLLLFLQGVDVDRQFKAVFGDSLEKQNRDLQPKLVGGKRSNYLPNNSKSVASAGAGILGISAVDRAAPAALSCARRRTVAVDYSRAVS